MEKRASHRVAIAGVFVVVVFSLVLLLVPTTTANVIQVGNANDSAPKKCIMLNYEGDAVELDPDDDDVEVIIKEAPFSDYPDDYPHDVVGLLKCQTKFDVDEITGSAKTYSATDERDCRVYFDPDDLRRSSFTGTWYQTISASGNSTLTCHFKLDPFN